MQAYRTILSRPLWARELKHVGDNYYLAFILSRPLWARELKQREIQCFAYTRESRPSWARELKPDESVALYKANVAPSSVA